MKPACRVYEQDVRALAPGLLYGVVGDRRRVGAALTGHVDTLIDDVKRAIGAPVDGSGPSMGFADVPGSSTTGSTTGSTGTAGSSSYSGGSGSAGGSQGGGYSASGSETPYGGSHPARDPNASSYRAD